MASGGPPTTKVNAGTMRPLRAVPLLAPVPAPVPVLPAYRIVAMANSVYVPGEIRLFYRWQAAHEENEPL